MIVQADHPGVAHPPEDTYLIIQNPAFSSIDAIKKADGGQSSSV